MTADIFLLLPNPRIGLLKILSEYKKTTKQLIKYLKNNKISCLHSTLVALSRRALKGRTDSALAPELPGNTGEKKAAEKGYKK